MLNGTMTTWMERQHFTAGPRICCFMNRWWDLCSLEMDGGYNFSHFMWAVFAHRQSKGSETEAAAEVPGGHSAQGDEQPGDVCKTGDQVQIWRMEVGFCAGAVLVMWEMLQYADLYHLWPGCEVQILTSTTVLTISWAAVTMSNDQVKRKVKQLILISFYCSLSCVR